MSQKKRRLAMLCLISIVMLTGILHPEPTARAGEEEPVMVTRGIARSYTVAIRKLVKKIEKQLDGSKQYAITVAGFHPTSGPNLIFSNILEAELVKEFSASPLFSVSFYKDNESAMKIIKFSQTAYFDRAIELGKFVSADYLVTGNYTVKGRKINANVTIQDLVKNLKIAGEDIVIRSRSLPKKALQPIPKKPKPIDDSLEELVQDIYVANEPNPKVLIGNFTYADSRVPSEFGSFLKNKVQGMLVKSGRFSVISGKAERDLNNAHKFDQSMSMRGLTVKKKVNLYVTGTYWDMGDKVGITLLLKDNFDQVLHSREVEIDRKSIPSNMSIKPTDLAMIQKQIVTYDAIHTPSPKGIHGSPSKLEIKVWPDKGDGAVYKKGETVQFNFKANKDCYLVLIHTDKSGAAQYLFPNRFARDNKVRGGQMYVIPDRNYNFQIDVSPPYGFEMIKALASQKQFSEIAGINWDKTDAVFIESSVKTFAEASKAQIQASDSCTMTTAE